MQHNGTGTMRTAAFGAAIALAALVFGGAAMADEAVRQGHFVGKSGHVTSGGVRVERTARGHMVRFGGDFSLDSAPDPWVGFGRSGRFAGRTQFTRLKKHKGAQSYTVPGSVDASAYDEVYVWCRKFAVPLGVARLK